MLDRIRVSSELDPSQAEEASRTLSISNFAKEKYRRKIDCDQWSISYELYNMPYAEVTLIGDHRVLITGSAARALGPCNPQIRHDYELLLRRSDRAQATLILDDEILQWAIRNLISSTGLPLTDEQIRNARVERVDIPINLNIPQWPLEHLLSIAASFCGSAAKKAYGHGDVRNLAIKFQRLAAELVYYDKLLQMRQMRLSEYGIARLELRLTTAWSVAQHLCHGLDRPSFLQISDLRVIDLYRSLAAFLHDFVGAQRDVAALPEGNLNKRQLFELVAAEACRQGVTIDGFTIPQLAERRCNTDTSWRIRRELRSIVRHTVDLAAILPLDHWNPDLIVVDPVAFHRQCEQAARQPTPGASEGGPIPPMVPPAELEQLINPPSPTPRRR